jgi:hypothetical protein
MTIFPEPSGDVASPGLTYLTGIFRTLDSHHISLFPFWQGKKKRKRTKNFQIGVASRLISGKLFKT